MTHNQSGNTLRGIFARMLISCDSDIRHTQRDCSHSQRALIPPLSSARAKSFSSIPIFRVSLVITWWSRVRTAAPEEALLRELKEIGGQTIPHPLKRRYEDLPMTKQQRVWGQVVRLRKNL